MRRWRRGELVWSGGKCFPWQSLPGVSGGTQDQSPLSAEGGGQLSVPHFKKGGIRKK